MDRRRSRLGLLALLVLFLLGGGAGLLLTGGGLLGGGSGAEPESATAVGATSVLRPAPRSPERRRARPEPADPPGPRPGAPEAGQTGGDGTAAGAAPAPDPLPPVTRRGRVVDDTTGEPLEGARVLVVGFDGDAPQGWYGDRTDAAGRFGTEVPREWMARGRRLEVRVAAKGYRRTTMPFAADEEAAVRLVPEPIPPRRGRIRGTVAGPDGVAWSGRLLLSGYDEMTDHVARWTIADAAGRFVLEGVPPGHWRFFPPRGAEAETTVPEGGEGFLHVRLDADWPGTLSEEAYAVQHRDLSRGIARGATDDTAGRGSARDLLLAMQDLEARWRAVGPTRELRVTGLAATTGAYLEARSTTGPNHRFTVSVGPGGRAHVPALSLERWQLVLIDPDGSEDSLGTVDVAAGDGPQEFEAPRRVK